MARGRKVGMQLAIKSADFLPKRLPAQPESVRELHLGTLIGEANGIKIVPHPDGSGEVMEGIKGAFQFTDAQDPERGVLQAPVLWVPEMIAEPVKNLLRDPETGELRGNKVEIAFEIFAIRSTAPLGYTWKAVPVFEPEVNEELDPIARIEAKARQLALPAPVSDAAKGKARDKAHAEG